MFKSVYTGRISQSIVSQIKEAIFQKRLTPGDKLPSERQLMEQFEASRVTIREALRTLEHSGILTIRRGTDGGAYVRDPSTKFVNSFLQDMFFMGKIRIPDLTEARLAVEPLSVKMATVRIKEASLRDLRTNIADTKASLKKSDYGAARLLNLEFHRLIAQSSENLVIFSMVDSIMDIMENNVSTIPISPQSISRTARDHEEIYLAIKSRNADRAQDFMLRHIQHVQKALELGDRKSPSPKRVS